MRKFNGKELRRQREMNDTRIEDLAVAMGRSYEGIRGYETGRTVPPANVIGALAELLGCDPGVFFTEETHDVAG